jgi:hypothetical protein
MKKTLIVALMMVAGYAYAGHPRCAGSYEPAKCEALEAKLAAQTPEQRKAAAQKLDAERQASMSIARSFKDATNPVVKNVCNPGDPYVGMSESSLNNLCKQTRWEGSTDYGSVKYTHYRTGYARVTVRNGVVAIVSY